MILHVRINANAIKIIHIKFTIKKQKILFKKLASILPKFLVDNRKLYSILSKGVHELSEEECLKYFDLIKSGIELILDEKFVEKEKATKIKKVTDDLSRVHNTIKNSDTPIQHATSIKKID